MKTVPVLLLATASLGSAATNVYCEYEQAKGTPCTNAVGLSSRCGPDTSCSVYEPCAPSAKELDECQSFDRCYPLNAGDKELVCLNQFDIDAFANYDACKGQADGSPCKAIVIEDKYEFFAMYEVEGGKCSKSVCLGSSVWSCTEKKEGDECAYSNVYDRVMYKMTGTCHSDAPGQKLACKMKTKVEVGPAKPLKIRDDSSTPAPSKSRATSIFDDADDTATGGSSATTTAPSRTRRPIATGGSLDQDVTRFIDSLTASPKPKSASSPPSTTQTGRSHAAYNSGLHLPSVAIGMAAAAVLL